MKHSARQISPFTPRYGRALSAITAGLIAGACEKRHLIVEYSAGATTVSAPAEVTRTPTYLSQFASIRAVAIRLPDQCQNQTASQVNGMATNSQVIMGSNCGVWLSELERSLTQAGFRVITWVRENENRADNIAEVARQIGADAVFMVNSLDTTRMLPGVAAGSRISYFESNPQGDRLQPAELPTVQRDYLRCLVWQRSGYAIDPSEWRRLVGRDCAYTSEAADDRDAISDVIGVASSLNVTAVHAGSGESIWFYNRRLVQQLRSSRNLRFLVRGRGTEQAAYWRPVEPIRASGPQVAVDRSRSDEQRTALDAEAPQDRIRAVELELVRSIVGDFVVRFRNGGGR
jgi:hypothetical protein